MTRKRFIKLLMGRHGFDKQDAEFAAWLVHQTWKYCPNCGAKMDGRNE